MAARATAAAAEGVTVHGVLWLLDVLVAKAAITAEIAAVASLPSWPTGAGCLTTSANSG